MDLTPEDFPVRVRRPVSWGEQDAFGHVNNVVTFRCFEDARIALFDRLGWMPGGVGGGVVPILARTEAVYRRPVHFPDTVVLGARVTSLGVDRLTIQHAVWSERQACLATFGEARVVAVAVDGGAPAALPSAVVDAIVEVSGPALRREEPR